MRMIIIILFSILMLGCVDKEVSYGEEVSYDEEQKIIEQPSVGVFEFSVPSELPTAFVGKPFTYSSNATGGIPPYRFTYEIDKIAYDDSKSGAYLSEFPCASCNNERLSFTPQNGEEGEYILGICAKDNGFDTEVCKNTTLYIISDVVKVKGSGKVSSSLVWDPRAYVVVRGSAGDVEDSKNGPDLITLVPVSQIPSVSLGASIPAKSPGGGASVELKMVANTTNVSVSASGKAACGKNDYEGADVFNMNDFQVLGKETYIGLNITNDGTKEKVVDIVMTGRSAISSDSVNYNEAGTDVHLCIEPCINETKIDIMWPYSGMKPGEEKTDSKVVRTIVAPGSHVVRVGDIAPFLWSTLGVKGCPSYAGISSRITITTATADLGDGKKPIRKIINSYVMENGAQPAIG